MRGRGYKKQQDIVLLESYTRLWSVWKVGEELGMCGQSVQERLARLGLKSRRPTNLEYQEIKKLYDKGFLRGDKKLQRLAKKLKRTIPWISRYAGKFGWTNNSRSTAPSSRNHFMFGVRIHPRWKQEICEIGGRLYLFKSSWEQRHARNLEERKNSGEITAWAYEPHTFRLLNEGKHVFYTPDFKVTYHDGRVEYHEVKGWMTEKSALKIKLFQALVYEPLLVFDKEFFAPKKTRIGAA